jgi:penicillin-insensitive murein endopeptidase
MFLRISALLVLGLWIFSFAAHAGDRPARELFGYTLGPAPMKPRPIGFYTKGCLAGGVQLPQTGPAWQAMRLSRNRNWGHPVLIKFLKRLAVTARQKDGWPGLLVGDLSQPRGGPMLSGHRSHQIGLDADIWLTPMPGKIQSYKRRETRAAISMLARGGLSVDPKKWSIERAKLIRRAAMAPEVARIFVHPAIKKALCEAADSIGDSRDWLHRVRPWYGHHYHFHVRLRCPKNTRGCKNQPEPKVGDGCGKPLDNWFERLKPKKIKKPQKPKKPRKKRQPLTLASLPVACTTVIAAGDKGRLKRLRYGVVGDVPPPVRNPKRSAGTTAVAATTSVGVLGKFIKGLKGKADGAPVAAKDGK